MNIKIGFLLHKIMAKFTIVEKQKNMQKTWPNSYLIDKNQTIPLNAYICDPATFGPTIYHIIIYNNNCIAMHTFGLSFWQKENSLRNPIKFWLEIFEQEIKVFHEDFNNRTFSFRHALLWNFIKASSLPFQPLHRDKKLIIDSIGVYFWN